MNCLINCDFSFTGFTVPPLTFFHSQHYTLCLCEFPTDGADEHQNRHQTTQTTASFPWTESIQVSETPGGRVAVTVSERLDAEKLSKKQYNNPKMGWFCLPACPETWCLLSVPVGCEGSRVLEGGCGGGNVNLNGPPHDKTRRIRVK